MSIEKKEMKSLTKRKVSSSTTDDPAPLKKQKKSTFVSDKNKKSGNFQNKHKKGPFTPGNQHQKLEKPKWNELKQKKKELKITRKKSKFDSTDLFDIDVKAKKIYEELKM